MDGPATFGCEARCQGYTCTLGSGAQVTVDSLPVHERHRGAGAAGPGGGGMVQTGSVHRNVGTLGEGNAALGGAMSGTGHKQVGGFGSVWRLP